MQTVEQKIWTLLFPRLESMGFRLVRVLYTGKERPTLQIMAEPLACTPENPVSITVDDCANLSRTISALLDVEEPITEAYHLEVSSTGVDRPLVTVEDFTRYAGKNIKLQTLETVEGRKRFKGILKGFEVEKNEILITPEEEKGERHIPYGQLKSAALLVDWTKF